MTSEIRSEIARRLDLAPDDVAPVLEIALARIRQQIAHYGYARLSDLGTFRRREGGTVFEPDPSLAEAINARFTGLHDLVIERDTSKESAYSPADDEAVPTVVDEGAPSADDEGVRPWEGTEEPDAPGYVFDEVDTRERKSERPPEEETYAPEADPSVDDGIQEPEAGVEKRLDDGFSEPEADRPLLEGTEAPDEANRAFDDGTYEPRAGTEDPDGEASVRLDADEESADEEASTVWNDLDGPSATHPLGPESDPPYEDADFSVLGEHENEIDDAGPSDDGPTVSWAPLGAADDPGRQDPDEMREISGDKAPAEDEHTPADAAAGEAPERTQGGESSPRSDRLKAPDRTAEPHGLRGEGPVRTVHPPSRRGKRRRDPKPLWFGVGIIVLGAVAAVAYFVLPDRPQNPAAPEAVQESAQESFQEPLPAESQPPSDTSAASEAEAVQEAQPPAAPAATPFASPLRSEAGIDPADGGYTIVVYSETDQNLAEGEVARYRGQGFRSDLISSQQEGITRFRVGVGQFETLEEAALRRDELAGEALPADAWVLGL